MPAEFPIHFNQGMEFVADTAPQRPSVLRRILGSKKPDLQISRYVSEQERIKALLEERGLRIKTDEGIEIELPTLESDPSGQITEGDDLTGADMPRRPIRVVVPGSEAVIYTPGTPLANGKEMVIE